MYHYIDHSTLWFPQILAYCPGGLPYWFLVVQSPPIPEANQLQRAAQAICQTAQGLTHGWLSWVPPAVVILESQQGQTPRWTPVAHLLLILL